MTPTQDILQAAEERFFTTTGGTVSDSLRGDVGHYADYCRALFCLKAAFGIHPADGIFQWEKATTPQLDLIAAGFFRARILAWESVS